MDLTIDFNIEIGKPKTSTRFKCIKNEDSRVMVQSTKIKRKWENSFEKLLNEKHRKVRRSIIIVTNGRLGIFVGS